MASNVFRTALLTAAMVVAVACSGGAPSPEGEAAHDRVTPEAWASGVCTATAEWIDEIAALNADLQENLDASSLETLRDSTVAYFDELLASTDRMIDRVEAAGVPDVDGGGDAAEHVLTGLATARAALKDARERAASLETDDPGTFSEKLREIGGDVATSLSDVADSMARFRSPALDAASQDVPECQGLAA